MWRRYRFYSKSYEDPRPMFFNPCFPWWESGIGEDYSILIAWLPATEDLRKYWPDAYDEEFTEEEAVTFSSRFARPDYFIESNDPAVWAEHEQRSPLLDKA